MSTDVKARYGELVRRGLKKAARDRAVAPTPSAKGSKRVGGRNWMRNEQFINSALANGYEIRLAVDPEKPLYKESNVYQRELRYLQNLGSGWA